MLKLEGKVVDNNLTREELLENIVICHTTEDDIIDIAEILSHNMGLNSRDIAAYQLYSSNYNIEQSVKLIDKRNGIIYGVLILSNYSLYKGSPIVHKSPLMAYALKNSTQINGFLFVIDERLRGCGFDKKMIKYVEEYIELFDICWVAVEKSLNTHSYWKRLGFIPLFEVGDGKFYVKILNNDALKTIYNNITEYYKNESYYNRVSRTTFKETFD